MAVWVDVSISDRRLDIKPRRISSLVTWVSGLRGETSVDWSSIDHAIDTGTAINGGLWFVLNTMPGINRYVDLRPSSSAVASPKEGGVTGSFSPASDNPVGYNSVDSGFGWGL